MKCNHAVGLDNDLGKWLIIVQCSCCFCKLINLVILNINMPDMNYKAPFLTRFGGFNRYGCAFYVQESTF